MDLQTNFNIVKSAGIDISEHMDTLKNYAEKSNIVVEMGVRTGNSTVALLLGRPQKLISYDIAISAQAKGVEAMAKNEGINFELIEANVLDVDIPECDLLFIDTLHTSEQLWKELTRHADKAKKWIIMHDTETFGVNGEIPGTQGLLYALHDYLDKNKHWKIKEQFKNNNGLTVLERLND